MNKHPPLKWADVKDLLTGVSLFGGFVLAALMVIILIAVQVSG